MKYKRLVTLLSIIGSIASLIGLIYIFYPSKGNNIKLDFVLSSYDNLTVFNNVVEPEIKAQFEYKGNKIDNLWKLNVVLKNVSDKTIIGDGQLKNIMSKDLLFFIKDGFQIIDKKLIISDFNHSLSIIGYDTIKLDFSQWRTGEKIEYSFYVTSDTLINPNIDMFYQPKDRQIVDGDIVFLNDIQVKEQVLISNKLGKPTKKFTYVLFIILASILTLAFFIIIISNPVGYVLRNNWNKKFLNKYNEHIIKNLPYSKESYLNKPENYYDWSKFKGEKYPNTWGLDFEVNKFINLCLIELLLLVLIFVQIVVIIDLIQLFP